LQTKREKIKVNVLTIKKPPAGRFFTFGFAQRCSQQNIELKLKHSWSKKESSIYTREIKDAMIDEMGERI
jgi:hypothetical protein